MNLLYFYKYHYISMVIHLYFILVYAIYFAVHDVPYIFVFSVSLFAKLRFLIIYMIIAIQILEIITFLFFFKYPDWYRQNGITVQVIPFGRYLTNSTFLALLFRCLYTLLIDICICTLYFPL